MMLDTFIKSFGFSGKTVHLLEPLLVKKKLARDETLATGDTPGPQIVFILKGCLRSYTRTPDGKKHTLEFFTKNDWFIGPLHGFDAVERSLLLIGGADFLCKATALCPEFITRCLMRSGQRIRAMQNHLFELTNSNTRERYLNFLQLYPSLATRLPQHMIARYLSMTPESLSRTRKKLKLPLRP